MSFEVLLMVARPVAEIAPSRVYVSGQYHGTTIPQKLNQNDEGNDEKLAQTHRVCNTCGQCKEIAHYAQRMGTAVRRSKSCDSCVVRRKANIAMRKVGVEKRSRKVNG
jgi:CO dehydrogenase/acetyl-CoA synthase alpha subunit